MGLFYLHEALTSLVSFFGCFKSLLNFKQQALKFQSYRVMQSYATCDTSCMGAFLRLAYRVFFARQITAINVELKVEFASTFSNEYDCSNMC
jgi:hypothetical protein